MSWLNRAIAAAGVAAGAYLGISALMARGLTRSKRVPAGDGPSSLGLAYETVTFQSRDGRAELSGWLIPPPGSPDMRIAMERRWIVMVHGHGSNRADASSGMLSLARDLHTRGFGILLFDLRASGESTGARGSAGFYERFDLLGALDYLVERGARRDRIGALGHSLGGVVALMVCADPGSAGAVVADSAFADLWMMIHRSQEGPAMALSLLNPGMGLMARLIYGININEISPVESVSISDTPTLLIHGEDDMMVPLEQARMLARALAISKPGEATDGDESLWIVPDAGHLKAYRNRSQEYVERVSRFFEENLEDGEA